MSYNFDSMQSLQVNNSIPADLKGGVLVTYTDGRIWTIPETRKKFLIPYDWQEARVVSLSRFHKPVKVKAVDNCLIMEMNRPMSEKEQKNLFDPKTMKKIEQVRIAIL